MDLEFLDIYSGTSVDQEENIDSVELMYRPSEQVFASVASQIVDKGWSIYPQDEERRPGRVNNETISWQSEHKLSEMLPSKKSLSQWIKHCPTLNVACVMGEGSGYACAIDIDVLDHDLSEKIVSLATEILGYTPLVRIGRAPKVALIYRYDPDDPVMSISRHFAETNEEGEIVSSENAIEILGPGKSITFVGKHHKTGRYFQWLNKSPINVAIDIAPVINGSMVSDFMEAINERIQNFHKGASFLVQPEDVEWDENADVKIPRLKAIAGTTPWVESSHGKVIDGREAYLTRLVYRFVEANPSLSVEQLAQLVAEQFQATAETSGRWQPNKVINEARGKIKRLKSKVDRGEITFVQRKAFTADGGETIIEKFKMPYSKKDLQDRGLSFLPPEHKRKELKGRIIRKDNPIVLTDEERRKKIANIQVGLRDALDSFFEDMFMANCGKSPENVRVHVIKAPTGAGKTSQTLRYIGEKKEEHLQRSNILRLEGEKDESGNIIQKAQGLDLTYVDERGIERAGRMPIVFLLPTYSNIEEVRVRAEVLNLDGTLSDEELKREARDRGIIAEEDLEARLGDLKRDAMNAGLDVMVYKGKIAAGCRMADKIQAAMEAGVGTAGFCKSTIKNEMGENEEVFCEFYHDCPAIKQRNMIQEHDLIFTPHPFMHLEIPEPLKHVRAVIADERIHHLFLHTAEFPLNNLTLPRKAAKLTKKEKANGITEFDLAQSREIAVEIVTDAFIEGKCPATSLYDFRIPTTEENDKEVSGFKLVEDCIRICTSAIQKDANISPKMTLDEVKSLCTQPTGKFVREEQRFWKILLERMQILSEYNLAQTSIANLQEELIKPENFDNIEKKKYVLERITSINKHTRVPHGDKDYRIQYVQEHVNDKNVRSIIRISWRSDPNWNNVPLLLLDASAAPEIINKIWNGAEVVSHDINGPLHMKVVGVVNRTFSNASIVGNPEDNETQRTISAKGLNKLRKALSTVSGLFGWSRVVAGGSILVRRIVNTDWMGPENVDWCHFGAMRGLDFAKHHAAAFSIGRMELPIRTIDGLVAALTYDDEEPENPFDIDGTGLTKEGNPLLLPTQMQQFKMRSGEVVEIPTPMHPGKWGRLIQKQYREEELLQFVGRLRPVYREGDQPIWFALSSVIPQELIIDDLIHIDDLVTARSFFWDAVRKTHGIVHPEVLFKVCPDYFKDENEAATAMRDFGFDPNSYETDSRLSQGFTPFYMVDLYNQKTVVFIRSEYRDKHAELVDKLTDLGFAFTEIIPIYKDKIHSLARPRVPDNVDMDLGSEEERKQKEQLNSDKTAVKVFVSGVKRKDETSSSSLTRSHPVTFAAGFDGNLRNLWLNYSDAEAKETLKRVWKSLEEEKKKKMQHTIISDENDSYEELGNNITDTDSLY